MDFSSASAAAQAAFRSALAAANGGGFPSTLLLQHMVTVPGCVLLMAEVVRSDSEGLHGSEGNETDAGLPPAAVPALDGVAWSLLPTNRSSSSSTVHISFKLLEELLNGEGTAAAAAALQQAPPNQLGGSWVEASAAAMAGLGGCCAGVVAQWGQQLLLKVLEGPPEQQQQGQGMFQHAEPLGSSRRVVRVVISKHNIVLVDGVKQLLSAEEVQVAGVGITSHVAEAEGGDREWPRVAAGSAFDGDRGARDARYTYLLLDLASAISSSSGGKVDGGASSVRPLAPAAAVTIALLGDSALDAAAEAGGDGSAVASASSGGGHRSGAPLGYAKVLLLPPEVAIELQAWLVQQQLSVHQVAPLLQDLAFTLGIRDALSEGLSTSRGVTSSDTPFEPAAGDNLGVANLTGLASSAAVVVEALLEYFRKTRLHSAEDFVLVLRQQLLVAMRRVTPLAAGVIPTREESSAAAGQASGLTLNAANAAEQGEAEDLAARGNSGSADSLRKRQDASARSGGPETGAEPEAALAGQAPMTLARNSISERAGSRREDVVAGGSSSSTISSSSKKAAVLQRPEYFSAVDISAAAAGGWRGFMLCWRAFQRQGVESQYLMFKAKHSRRLDWGGKALSVVVLMIFMLRYLQMVQWQVWPPYKIFGKQVRAERLGCCVGDVHVWQQCTMLQIDSLIATGRAKLVGLSPAVVVICTQPPGLIFTPVEWSSRSCKAGAEHMEKERRCIAHILSVRMLMLSWQCGN